MCSRFSDSASSYESKKCLHVYSPPLAHDFSCEYDSKRRELRPREKSHSRKKPTAMKASQAFIRPPRLAPVPPYALDYPLDTEFGASSRTAPHLHKQTNSKRSLPAQPDARKWKLEPPYALHYPYGVDQRKSGIRKKRSERTRKSADSRKSDKSSDKRRKYVPIPPYALHFDCDTSGTDDILSLSRSARAEPKSCRPTSNDSPHKEPTAPPDAQRFVPIPPFALDFPRGSRRAGSKSARRKRPAPPKHTTWADRQEPLHVQFLSFFGPNDQKTRPKSQGPAAKTAGSATALKAAESAGSRKSLAQSSEWEAEDSEAYSLGRFAHAPRAPLARFAPPRAVARCAQRFARRHSLEQERVAASNHSLRSGQPPNAHQPRAPEPLPAWLDHWRPLAHPHKPDARARQHQQQQQQQSHAPARKQRLVVQLQQAYHPQPTSRTPGLHEAPNKSDHGRTEPPAPSTQWPRPTARYVDYFRQHPYHWAVGPAAPRAARTVQWEAGGGRGAAPTPPASRRADSVAQIERQMFVYTYPTDTAPRAGPSFVETPDSAPSAPPRHRRHVRSRQPPAVMPLAHLSHRPRKASPSPYAARRP